MANSLDQSAEQIPGFIKEYRGSQKKAMGLFEEDAVKMAGMGYFPAAQNWIPGKWGAGAIVLALLLCLIGIGFLVLLYLLIVKPDGILIVTYRRRTVS